MTHTLIDKVIDWWTLGVLLYEMLSGLPPFYDGAQMVLLALMGTESFVLTHVEITDKMYQKILTDPLVFGPEIGSEARSILTSLLDRDPTRRLGVKGAEEIKKHPFFEKHIDFKKLLQKKIQPPFKPSVSSPVVSPFTRVTERRDADGPTVSSLLYRMCQTLIPYLPQKHPSIAMLMARGCLPRFKRSSLVRCCHTYTVLIKSDVSYRILV